MMMTLDSGLNPLLDDDDTRLLRFGDRSIEQTLRPNFAVDDDLTGDDDDDDVSHASDEIPPQSSLILTECQLHLWNGKRSFLLLTHSITNLAHSALCNQYIFQIQPSSSSDFVPFKLPFLPPVVTQKSNQ